MSRAATLAADRPDENEAPLPRWACIVLAVACIALGVWASYITLRYFEHGAAALEGDETTRALAVAAALMFVVLEMAAFGLAALLTWRAIRSAKWKLVGFAVAVLAFECATIILVQHAITKGADLTAGASSSRAAELRASIEAQRATAAGLRENAAAQSASRFRQSREAGAAALRDSLAIERSIREQSAELAALEAARKPTTTEILGEAGALAYAVARGLLVSVGGLVMFGAAGALLRAARGAASPSAAALTTTRPPASTGSTTTSSSSPTAPGFTPRIIPGGRFAFAAAPLAAVAAATVPTPAPAAPVPFQAATPRTDRFEIKAPAGASIAKQPAPTEQAIKAGQEQLEPPATMGEVQKKRRLSGEDGKNNGEKKRKARASVAAGKKVDTGVGEADGSRYGRVLAAVKAGEIPPSIRAIQGRFGGSPRTVQGYQAQMLAEGVIVQKGQGYALAG